jgi:hypothetical protein
MAVTARLVRPVGPPTTLDASFDREWAGLPAEVLTTVRKTAENWRSGLAAILGLVSLFAVIQAPRATKDLKDWSAWLAGGCLLLAVLTAIIGAAAALRAAYGIPAQVTHASFVSGGGRDGLTLKLAALARKDLHLARWMTYVAMALLTVAVAVTWVAPTVPSNLAEVKTTSGLTLCGALNSSSDGHVQLDSRTAGTRMLRLSDLVSINVVESCDG